jgi:hypothetical protein
MVAHKFRHSNHRGDYGRRITQLVDRARGTLAVDIIRCERMPSLVIESLVDPKSHATMLAQLVTQALAHIGRTGVDCLCCGKSMGANNSPGAVASQVGAVAIALPHAASPRQAIVNAICCECADNDDDALREKVLAAYHEHMGMNEIRAGAA